MRIYKRGFHHRQRPFLERVAKRIGSACMLFHYGHMAKSGDTAKAYSGQLMSCVSVVKKRVWIGFHYGLYMAETLAIDTAGYRTPWIAGSLLRQQPAHDQKSDREPHVVFRRA
ncbi:MAG: hypothetical protein QJR02_03450 [Sinobacteraceae bacterium]|nr:hypothetical protein [Nevskiaceae bacterium]